MPSNHDVTNVDSLQQGDPHPDALDDDDKTERIESVEPTLTSVDLTTIVREVFDRFGRAAASAECALVLRDRGPVVVSGDRSQLFELVAKLLGDAVKYGARKPVHVSVSREGGAAMIVITHNGSRIAPKHDGRIVERDERVVPEQEPRSCGRGLWTAREIVEAHGGTICVENPPGADSTIRVQIPLLAVETAAVDLVVEGRNSGRLLAVEVGAGAGASSSPSMRS
jgi:signal transduction histidine kinase